MNETDTAAVQPRRRGRGFETAEQAAERAKFDVALVAVTPAAMRALDAIRPMGVAAMRRCSGCRNLRLPAG